MLSKFCLAKRTQVAFLSARFIGTPCWCLLSMLAFILYKNESLNPVQITAIVALKPGSSLLSPYWSQAIYQRPDKIVANLIVTNFLRYLPFLFVPWLHHPWYLILSFGSYMMLSRAAVPAWMELLKQNLPETKREQFVGYGTIVDFLGTAVLAVVIGILLDHYAIWEWLFFITAAFGLLSTLFLIPLSSQILTSFEERQVPSFRFKERLSRPWKQVWELICQHKDFTKFQIGFMLGAAGLMIMQPAFPKFFIDTLHLSFTEMGVAISLCKGIGVALSSFLWTRLFRKLHIFTFCALVTLFASLFPFFLLSTPFHLMLLYLAYGFYGIMQGGSELSWHMSGLVFAQEKDSSIFSVTNVLTVGLRGCIIPVLGSMLLPFLHPLGVILVGALLCLLASLYFFLNGRAASKSIAINQ